MIFVSCWTRLTHRPSPKTMTDIRDVTILALVLTLWWALWHHEQAVKRWRRPVLLPPKE